MCRAARLRSAAAVSACSRAAGYRAVAHHAFHASAPFTIKRENDMRVQLHGTMSRVFKSLTDFAPSTLRFVVKSSPIEMLEQRLLLTLEAHLLDDVNANGAGSNPQQFVQVGNQTFFLANDGVHGRELWVTDGKSGGTHL